MLTLGPLSFSAAWVLLGLLAVPAIIFLLRATPPPPRLVRFPALRLLMGLPRTAEEPARTPLWLILLRALLAILILLALAGPVLRGQAIERSPLPLLLAVDDGWASADDWASRKQTMLTLIDEARQQNRSVALLTTAPRVGGAPPVRLPASDAAARIEGLDPVPWPVDRGDAAKRLAAAAWSGESRIVWLSDGLAAPGTDTLEAALKKRGKLTLAQPRGERETLLLGPPRHDESGFEIPVRRADAASAQSGVVRARAADGHAVAEGPFAFSAGQNETPAHLALPLILANDVARIEIEGRRSAGAVVLLDERSRKRSVGLVSGGADEEGQPLLSDLFYLERALTPFAQVSRGTISTLTTPDRAIIMLADVGRIEGADHDSLARWIEAGGTLVRFAGPRLAAQADDLVPVPLRAGGRTLGGALSWDTPEPLGAFDPDGPFAGLTASPDIHVTRQVLAEPVPDLASRTWARLADGTPLVTAVTRGAGRMVLIHATANTDWSDLPLSGLYVEMLKRLVALAHTPRGIPDAAPSGSLVLAPRQTLDAYGVLGTPPSATQPLEASRLAAEVPGPRHPPGLYGPEDGALAFNLGQTNIGLAPLARPDAVSEAALIKSRARELRPWLLGASFLLGLADGVVGLMLGGGLAMLRRRAGRLAGAFSACLVVLVATNAAPTHAQSLSDADSFALSAVHSFRLAYVRTGDAAADNMSRAGLEGLGRTLAERTAVEPDKPLGVDLETDELALFPLLYWQVPADQPSLSDAAVGRLDRFMKTGGTLIVDTADADRAFGADMTGPGAARLRVVLEHLDLPPLEPVPTDHVLTRSFYLLQEFPGRFANGRVWIETARGGADHDGVASIIMGSNDWAAAWARDANGRPLVLVTPGGDIQRERALRFGVNLVMYALTGNYKADQVHVPALLERLGQ